jgi:hypothetical protein
MAPLRNYRNYFLNIEALLPGRHWEDRDEVEGSTCSTLPAILRGGTLMGIDEVDALPESLRYCWFDFLCTLISILTYVADLVMDCIVAYYFYHLAVDHGIYHYWYFGLTTFFIVMPALTMTGFSFRWYLMDNDNHHLPRVGTLRWAVRLAALLCQLAPILRYLDSMRYGILSRIEKYREDRAPDAASRRKHRQVH